MHKQPGDYECQRCEGACNYACHTGAIRIRIQIMVSEPNTNCDVFRRHSGAGLAHAPLRF